MKFTSKKNRFPNKGRYGGELSRTTAILPRGGRNRIKVDGREEEPRRKETREGDSLVSKTHPRMDLRSGLLQNQNENLLLWGLNRLKLLFCLPRL